MSADQPLLWSALERGETAATLAFCQELHSTGWAIIRLPDEAAPELATLRNAAAIFFAAPADMKAAAGEEEAGPYVGYRDSPKQGAEFLETYLASDGGCYPHVEPPEIALAAAALHFRLLRVGRTLLSHLAAHLRAPTTGLLGPMHLQTEEGLPSHGRSSRYAVIP